MNEFDVGNSVLEMVNKGLYGTYSEYYHTVLITLTLVRRPRPYFPIVSNTKSPSIHAESVICSRSGQ
jgi:hypothetical protein